MVTESALRELQNAPLRKPPLRLHCTNDGRGQGRSALAAKPPRTSESQVAAVLTSKPLVGGAR